MFNVKNGKVTWCPEAILISNKDGLEGKTTIKEYNNADLKILAFGDSFTHWNQKGYTWPDLLQENLAKILDVNVSVLNYGRGGYGVLQMFDLAEAKIKEHQPDLVIFAFINDDLTRGRWWTKTVNIGGYTRSLCSSNKEDFNLKIASDMYYIVNPSVDLAWCQKSLGSSESNQWGLMAMSPPANGPVMT
ncbi:Lipase, GDSL domain protein [Candidatus Thiomargarita nelsonii]|uniref:Lipase, GDSL domain protein n=1 Tax=Candidatus Thiomargarita nelsonii TaxID=1003181 RepID=A0A176S3E5_9GAMM|nr:Lipase, GDSL domain protein [Candidatus Thiomargarita nelsonii]